MSAHVALLLFLVPLALTAGFVLLRTVDRGLAFSLVDEDHPVEWATVAGFATAAAFAAVAGRTLLRSGRRVPAIAYFVFAVCCLVVVGEEISWGQRILGFGTPEPLADVNTQDTTTVHNLDSLEEPFKGAQLLIGLYGALGACAVRLIPRAATRLRLPREKIDLFFPPLFLTSSFLVLAVVQLAIASGADDPPHNKFYGEFAEFTLAFGVAAFALLGWRRLTRH